MFGRINIPQLFDTNAVMLRVFTSVKVELSDQFLTKMPAATFCKYGVFRTQLHARHIAVFL